MVNDICALACLPHTIYAISQGTQPICVVACSPKYPDIYNRYFRIGSFGFGKEMGVENVMRTAFGDNTVYMADKDVLSSSLVVTSYQLTYDRPFIFYFSSADKGAQFHVVS